jgi:Mg2+ and Co2+ transporter CorA
MTPEDEAFNDIERMAEMRRKAVSAALKEHQEHMLQQIGDYERGLVDGRRMQSRIDKAVNAMSKREWVWLTADDIKQIWNGEPMLLPWDMTRILAIQQASKEKNT